MRAHDSYDYAVIRVVPRVERGEFMNVGVIVSCEKTGYLKAAVELDEARLRALDPRVDLATLRRHLQAMQRICAGGPDAGPIGLLPQRARFHWLTARRSAIIQTSTVHMGRCGDMDAIVEHLMERMVRVAAD
ncbi:hypothetical protein GCM10007164_25800 [Luteimonas padinae]|uniref:DUF3037 domain-containing protein n=2 Tax=Luteimonas TaxID=83614 RepID=A0ABV6SSJ1_9GAMM|nr:MULTISPECIES: DUF3037 domain-containing protein [Luteimonas]MBD7989061.1 DUF3037 domain-containing protein [Luteimonas colneyensis]GHD74749.1 hypothetical protein GCM10007164_25800 [Luteimonas padinae]